MDATDGFAGLGSSAVAYLDDEYTRKSKLVFPTIQSDFGSTTAVEDSVRTINIALGFHSLAEHSSLFVPLSLGSSGWRSPGEPRQFPQVIYDVSIV